MDNPEKIMLFLFPLVTLGLFFVGILVLWALQYFGPGVLPQ
jgi:hypothetical protein